MQEVVKKKIMQWLDVGSIYPIADHSWVCPFKCVSLKGRMIVVPHERNEFVRMQLVTGWRFYMDYRNLNAWAKKEPFCHELHGPNVK